MCFNVSVFTSYFVSRIDEKCRVTGDGILCSKTQSLFWNAFELNSKTGDGYRVNVSLKKDDPYVARPERRQHAILALVVPPRPPAMQHATRYSLLASDTSRRDPQLHFHCSKL